MNAPDTDADAASRAVNEGFRALAAANYISLESYRKSGAPVRTPVWITEDSGRLYCWTLTNTGKVKRIRANPLARLAKCDARGKLQGGWVAAEARLLASRPALKSQLRRLRAKYGWKFLAYRLMSILSRAESIVIEFTPADSP